MLSFDKPIVVRTLKTLFSTMLAGLAFASSAPTDFPVPPGFELQILEPTGGRIALPSDWFYRERHNRVSYTWIISKEDPDKGPYETGVRIQTFTGVKKGTGKSPEEFVRNFISQKKSSATVLSECEAHDQGLFTRVCLETTEAADVKGPPAIYHIQYSAFWGNAADIVIVMTAGTSSGLWPQYKDSFATMGRFELIDMTRFGK
jgi:hypothetical protein